MLILIFFGYDIVDFKHSNQATQTKCQQQSLLGAGLEIEVIQRILMGRTKPIVQYPSQRLTEIVSKKTSVNPISSYVSYCSVYLYGLDVPWIET
jgi:hypothetical protein